MGQEFPKMIYHIQLGQKVVKDHQEQEHFESLGWISDYRVFQKKNTRDELIKYHLGELERLKKEEESYIIDNYKEREQVTTTEEPPATPPELSKEPMKRRGRPKKEA
jgi:hypothetical protein